MLQKIRWFLLLLGLLVVIIVAFQNSDQVDLQVLFFQGRYSLTLLLLASSAVSFLLGALMTAWMFRGRKRQAKQKKQASPKPGSDPAPAEPASTKPS